MKAWLRAGEGWGCSSMPARVTSYYRPSDRSFSGKSGRGFSQPFSDLAGKRKNGGRKRGAAEGRTTERRRSADAMASVDARGLGKGYGKTVALDDVNVRVEEGRIVGLIGPNGAGKITAVNA